MYTKIFGKAGGALDFSSVRPYCSFMNLSGVLSPQVVTLDLAGETKQEIIEALLDILVETGKVSDRQTALAALLERERKMSTGIEHGVAIPHGKTDVVDGLAACIGLKKEGVDFDSLDGEPSKIFIMTLSPLHVSGPHIQFLAEVSRLLQDGESRKSILEAKTAEELLAVLL